jgi:hypothetical protein
MVTCRERYAGKMVQITHDLHTLDETTSVLFLGGFVIFCMFAYRTWVTETLCAAALVLYLHFRLDCVRKRIHDRRRIGQVVAPFLAIVFSSSESIDLAVNNGQTHGEVSNFITAECCRCTLVKEYMDAVMAATQASICIIPPRTQDRCFCTSNPQFAGRVKFTWTLEFGTPADT